MKNDFRNFAVHHLGMSSNTLDSYAKAMNNSGITSVTTPTADYMNPYILEERQLNVTQMDVFSRLMMDRIIFLGTQVSDQSANIIQAQLLYLDSVDPDKDLYKLSRWFGICRSRHLRHNAIYQFRCIHNMHRNGSFDGSCVACGRRKRKALCTSSLSCYDSSAYGGHPRTGLGY